MTTNRRKIQLVLDEEAQTTLASLQEATGAGSMAEVLRDALGVYNSLREMLLSDGHKRLALVDRQAGELQELFIPSLMRGGAAIVPGPRSTMAAVRRAAATAAAGTDRTDVAAGG